MKAIRDHTGEPVTAFDVLDGIELAQQLAHEGDRRYAWSLDVPEPAPSSREERAELVAAVARLQGEAS